jgi:uncharacterized protein
MGAITDLTELRGLIGEPGAATMAKERPSLDQYDRLFLSKSPFLCLGSCGADGRVDVTVRGDPPGFVRVLDDRTLFIPERPGNRRADSMGNIMSTSRVGIVAFIPGVDEVLRIVGTATVTDDSELLAGSAIRERLPKVGIVIHVDRVYFHCGKALKRSGLWEGRYQIERSEFPPLAEILHAQKWGGAVESIQAEIDESYTNRMY